MTISELKGTLQNPASSEIQKKYATTALKAYSDTLKRWSAKGETGRHVELLAEDNADCVWRGIYQFKKRTADGVEFDELVLETDPEAPGYLFVQSMVPLKQAKVEDEA